MSKSEYNIKWRNSDIKELNKSVRSFNAKITRLEKKGLNVFLPERLSINEAKKTIKTRKDYNRFIQSAKSFMKKGATDIKVSEKGLALTKWEIQQLRNKEQRVRVLQEKYMIDAKQKIKTTRKKEKPISFKFETASIKDYQKYLLNVEKRLQPEYYQEREQQYLDNYIKALKLRFGTTAKTNKLEKYLRDKGAKAVVAVFYNDFDMGIEYVYDLTISDDELLNNLSDKWYGKLG